MSENNGFFGGTFGSSGSSSGGGGGDSIYTADGTLTGDRTVDLDNNDLTFNLGNGVGGFTVDGSLTTGATAIVNFKGVGVNNALAMGDTGFLANQGITNQSVLSLLNTSNQGIKIKGSYSGIYSSFTEFKKSTTTSNTRLGHFLNNTRAETQYYNSSDDLVHHITLGSPFACSFFRNGVVGGFVVGSNAVIGTEDISLQGSTLIKGNGTSTGSALSIYDNDTTPNKLWDFLDNGTLNGNKSKTTLIAQNNTSNSSTDYILNLRNSVNSASYFFVGNGGEVRIGKSAINNGTGDKSADILWGADLVTKSGSGNYSILMGHSVTANYSGNDAIGLGRTITISNQRQIGIGQAITLGGEGSFGIGRTLTSTVGDTNMMGTALTSNGRYSTLMGKYLQSTATGGSIIGNGNTSTGAKLVNNTANSLGLGWNTTTPQHLFKSDGVNLTLPTSATGLSSGDLWNNNGEVRIGTSTPTPVSSIYTADGTISDNRTVLINDSKSLTIGNNSGGLSGTKHTESALEYYVNGVKEHEVWLKANNYVGFFNNGFTGIKKFYIGGFQNLGDAKINLTSPTAIKGVGTSTGSALAIYDNDTTPNKLWDFLDNGDLNGSNNRITNTIVNPSVDENTTSGFVLVNADQKTMAVLTAMSGNASISAPTGTPVQGQNLIFRFKDDGTARALTWNAIFRAIGITLPTTTTANKLLYIGCKYNSTDTKWDVVSVQEEA